MTLVQVLTGLVLVGVIAGAAALLLGKKRLPLPPVPLLKKKRPEMSPQEKAALLELAQTAASRYPELGTTGAGLLADIETYRKQAHSWSDTTTRILLEKMLQAGNLRQAISYWQVHEFLDYRDRLKKTKKT